MAEIAQEEQEEKSYVGLGGWLILPLLLLFLTPLYLGYVLQRDIFPIFLEGYWPLLTTPGEMAYDPMWAPLILFQAVGKTLIAIFAIVLLVLFLYRSSALPKLFICFLLLSLAFAATDFYVAKQVRLFAGGIDIRAVQDVVAGAVSLLIGVPYFLMSKRVRQTFVY